MLAHYIFWSSQEALVPQCLLCLFANTLFASICKVNQSFLGAWLLGQYFPCSKEKYLLSKSYMSIYHYSWLASSPWAYHLLHSCFRESSNGTQQSHWELPQQRELLLLHYSKILALCFKVKFPFPRHPSAGSHSVIASCQSSSLWTTAHLLETWIKTSKKSCWS